MMNNDRSPTLTTEQQRIERILQALDTNQRVDVPFETGGEQYKVTIHNRNGIYRCETPLQLHIYETEKQVRSWLLDQGYVIR
jgi:hypothetical protein